MSISLRPEGMSKNGDRNDRCSRSALRETFPQLFTRLGKDSALDRFVSGHDFTACGKTTLSLGLHQGTTSQAAKKLSFRSHARTRRLSSRAQRVTVRSKGATNDTVLYRTSRRSQLLVLQQDVAHRRSRLGQAHVRVDVFRVFQRDIFVRSNVARAEVANTLSLGSRGEGWLRVGLP